LLLLQDENAKTAPTGLKYTCAFVINHSGVTESRDVNLHVSGSSSHAIRLCCRCAPLLRP